MSLLEDSIAPLCNVLEESPEAPVLGKVLDAVLALAVALPKTEVSKVLGKILPVVASRLKRAAPQVSYASDVLILSCKRSLKHTFNIALQYLFTNRV